MANIVKNQKIGAIVAGGFAALLVVAACIGGGEKTDSPNLEHEVEVACQDAKYYSASEFYQKM